MKRVKHSTSTTINVLGLVQAGQPGLSVHRDPQPGDIMRMSRKMVEQVKRDRRASARDHAYGLPERSEEAVPLCPPQGGWPVEGTLSMRDAALVVSVPMAYGLICCVLTQDGRLLALRNASYDDGSAEFLRKEVSETV